MKTKLILKMNQFIPFSSSLKGSENNPTNTFVQQRLKHFFQKSSVKILIIDSGLGGISVASDVIEGLKVHRNFKNAEVIFFNAQPYVGYGFNDMKNHIQRVKVFDNILKEMDNKFKADILLIACNTLSVLYPSTEYAKSTNIPVVGIIETGVELIQKNMKKKRDTWVIIFATDMTVSSGIHKMMLMDRGIPSERIITKACPRLVGSIEQGPHSDKTRALVNSYVDSVITEFHLKGEAIFVSLNCTHYGYIANLFREAFQSLGIQIIDILDPNPFMANFMFLKDYLQRHPACEVEVKIYSQPELSDTRITSIAELIAKNSPQTAKALKDYTYVPDFFEWRSVLEEYPDSEE